MRRALGLLSLILSIGFGIAGPAAAGTALSPVLVQKIAREWMADRFGTEIEAALEPMGTPRELPLPSGDVSVNVMLQSGSVESGTLTALVEAVATDGRGGRETRSTIVTFRVNALREVVLAVRELPRRVVVGPSDIRRERWPLSRVPAGAVRDPKEVIGKELLRTLAPGEAVTAQSLAIPLVIRRGATVSLVLEGPNFRIVARGVAAEDGALGAPIRVINQTSRREVTGRVEDEHTVRVSF